ncbi:MAG: spermidine/putrescine ABC transporter substrate-binding protein [Bryobacteraceae bacterium]|nr:spermidine/putrescine ABC transporter substrate-binding protein [Bryobacteraceae bacterium]
MTRRALLFFPALSGLGGCLRPKRRRLNVFNWSNYTARETLPRFERETGIEVRLGVYESNEEMLARVMSGNSGWDVAFPSNYFIGPMRELGLLAPLEHRRLSRLGHLEPRFQRPGWDPALSFCVPLYWGSSGILASPALAPVPSSYADLWNPLYARRITMLDDPAEVYGAALRKLGRSLNASSPDDLRLAHAEALRQKPLLRAYLNAEARDLMAAGELAACQTWATTAQQAISAAPHLRFIHPADGFALYADCAVVLRESRRRELAHLFLDYLLRADVAAEIAIETFTATAVAPARQHLPEHITRMETLFPAEETLRRGEWFEPLPPAAQRLRDRLWTELKSA